MITYVTDGLEVEEVGKSSSYQTSDSTNNEVSRPINRRLSYVQPRANKHKKASE